MLTKLQNLRQKNSDKRAAEKGFTIIEVMIVLAIAGLILLIIFLAVPALQRNSRSTSKREDVNKVLGAVGEHVSNNNGRVPVTADIAALQTSANLSPGITIHPAIGTTVGTVAAPTVDQIQIVTGVRCNPAAAHTTAAAPTATNYQAEVLAANTRSYVAIYNVEAAGGNLTTQCQGS